MGKFKVIDSRDMDHVFESLSKFLKQKCELDISPKRLVIMPKSDTTIKLSVRASSTSKEKLAAFTQIMAESIISFSVLSERAALEDLEELDFYYTKSDN